MPTGYTAGVADGNVTDFRTFALRCARNFGATIMQREDPMDVLPKLREESDFYAKELAKQEKELARLNRLTLAKAEAEQEAEYREQVRIRNSIREEHAPKRDRYLAMLAEVRAWKPPTTDHAPMKKFMIDQLEESIRFDCNDEWPMDTPLESTATWLEKKRARAAKMVERYREEVKEERKRVAGANAWITKLWESLPADGTSVTGPKSDPTPASAESEGVKP